jgi:hypothetical protein
MFSATSVYTALDFFDIHLPIPCFSEELKLDLVLNFLNLLHYIDRGFGSFLRLDKVGTFCCWLVLYLSKSSWNFCSFRVSTSSITTVGIFEKVLNRHAKMTHLRVDLQIYFCHDFDTYECDYNTHKCDFNKLVCNFHTHE